MNNDIDKYMTIAEAAYKWSISQETVKNKLKPSLNDNQIETMIKQGLIKYFQKPNGQRKYWIISEKAMEQWFKNIHKKD